VPEAAVRRGPEEIGAATQRRLLGASPFSGAPVAPTLGPLSDPPVALRSFRRSPILPSFGGRGDGDPGVHLRSGGDRYRRRRWQRRASAPGPNRSSTGSTRRSATPSPRRPRPWRSWPEPDRARPGSSPVGSRGARSRDASIRRTSSRGHVHPEGGRRAQPPPRRAGRARTGHSRHVPRAGARPPAQPRGRSRRCSAGAARPQGAPHRSDTPTRGRPPGRRPPRRPRPRAHRGAGPRPGRRDRMGEVAAGAARFVRPRGRRRGPRHAARRGRRLRRVPPLRGGEAPARHRRLRRPGPAMRSPVHHRRGVRRRHTLAVPARLRRRVPGRHPGQLRLVRAWAGRAADLCVGRATVRPVPSTASRVPNPAPSNASRSCSRRGDPSASRWATGPRRRSPPPPRAALGPGAPRARANAGARRAAPRIVSPTRRRRRGRRRGRDLRRSHGRGVRWSSMAVLYRTNAQAARFEAILGAAGIPVRTRGGSRFVDDPAVREALDSLREAERAGPGRPFSALLVDPRGRPTRPGDRPEHRTEPAGARHAELPPPGPHPAAPALPGAGERGDGGRRGGPASSPARAEYLAARRRRGSVDGSWRSSPPPARRRAGRRRRPRRVPCCRSHGRQGPGVRRGHVTGVEAGLCDLAGRTDRRDRRGATPPLRGAEPRRTRVTISWARGTDLGL